MPQGKGTYGTKIGRPKKPTVRPKKPTVRPKKPTVRPRPKKDRPKKPKKPESYLKGVWRKYLNMKTSSGAPAISLGLMPLIPEKRPKKK